MFDLDRFKTAQDADDDGFAEALRQLTSGRKTGHWIWYVFPQLRGLGQSPTSVHYGLDGVAEATAYLQDPVLRERLFQVTAVVRRHVAPQGGGSAPLERMMGSGIDAAKLVSSMTLFGDLAARLRDAHADPALARFVGDATAILAAARAQGYPPCAFTERQLIQKRDPA